MLSQQPHLGLWTERQETPTTSHPSALRGRSARHGELLEYLYGLLAVALSTGVSFLVRPYAQLTDLTMIYLLSVVIVATRFSVRVSLFAALAAILGLDFFFIPPLMAFAYPDLKNFVTFFAILVVSGVISGLNEAYRREQGVARRNSRTTATLYRFVQDLSSAVSIEQLITIARRQLGQTFNAETRVLLASVDGIVPDHDGLDTRPEDLAKAQLAWSRGELVTATENGHRQLWLPLVGLHRPVGILQLRLHNSHVGLDEDHLQLLEACSTQLAGSMERISLGSAVQRAQVEIETERLRNALLSTVSHDFKTPLATIIAAGSTLTDHETLDVATRSELTTTIVESAERLDGLVTNLLSATGLESGLMHFVPSPEALEDLIGASLARFRERLRKRKVNIDVPVDLPLVAVDPRLIDLVLRNLIENALRYAPEGSSLYITAARGRDGVLVSVGDEGPGILPDEREKVFEKFYRGSVARKNDGGTGLGLMICRAALRVHGGRIRACERPGGGALIEFTLPSVKEFVAEDATGGLT